MGREPWAAGTVVDIHNHQLPARFVEAVRKGGSAHGFEVVSGTDGVERLMTPDGAAEPMFDHRVDERLRMSEMARAGIDLSVESVFPPIMSYGATEKAGEWAARTINQALASNAGAYPSHAAGMATVPLQFPSTAAAVLAEAVEQLGLRAVQIATHVNGMNLDDRSLDPFWEVAERTGVLVFVHPVSPVGRERLSRYHLINLVGNPQETSIAVASIIFGGVLDRYPALKVCFAHAGGYAPWIRGRWRHGQSVRSETRSNGVVAPVDDYFAKVYFDTVIHDVRSLRFLIDVAGARNVLHGTDFSADMGNWEQVPMIRSLPGLTPSETDAILGGNALRLLGLRPQPNVTS